MNLQPRTFGHLPTRPRRDSSIRPASGFTLIEVLVAMAIVGLLVAIAVPSYLAHIQRAQRAQAAATLLQAQQFMERLYSVQGSYLSSGGSLPVLPVALQSVTADGREIYRIRVKRADAISYQLQAEPQGSVQQDACGALTLDHTSLRGRTGTRVEVQACWR